VSLGRGAIVDEEFKYDFCPGAADVDVYRNQSCYIEASSPGCCYFLKMSEILFGLSVFIMKELFLDVSKSSSVGIL
jgi:hypothetical protein